MELAESRRLLYVACTRAADLLILSGKEGNSRSWLAEVQAAWSIEPEQEGLLPREGYTLRVVRPAAPPGVVAALEAPARPTPIAAGEGVTTLPWLALPWPAGGDHRPLAATRLARLVEEQAAEVPHLRPAVEANGAGGARQAGALGRILHRLLADWPALAEPDRLLARAASYARHEGIFDQSDLVAVVVDALARVEQLRHSPLFGEIDRARQRFSELPFSVQTAAGPVHGLIDLLYQDDSGAWHLLDWKTTPVTLRCLAETAERFRPQLALYAQAGEATLGARPQATLCFLGQDILVHRFDDVWTLP
jgi:ATP-dependent exoDNAse (exonuclease V) beta subunit